MAPIKIQHRHIQTLSDLKTSPITDRSNEKKAYKNFLKNKVNEKYSKKESIRQNITSQNDESDLDESNFDYQESLYTENIEAELSRESLKSFPMVDKELKLKKEFMRTMEDNFKLSDKKKEKKEIKNLDKHRKLLKHSKSKFGGKATHQSLSSKNKTKRSLESRERDSHPEDRNSRSGNSIKRMLKEPPYKPIGRRNQYVSNTVVNPNSEQNNRMKMSFRKSGSVSKRSRLLRTEDEEESFSVDVKRNQGFKLNREKLKNELKKHKTPNWSKVRKEGVKHKGNFNEYYDEIEQQDEERIKRINPSEFDSDIKVSESSGFLGKFENKIYENVKNNFDQISDNDEIFVKKESRKNSFSRYKEKTKLQKEIEDNINNLITHQTGETNNITVQSEVKRTLNCSEEPLYSSNIVENKQKNEFENIIKDQENQKNIRLKNFKKMIKKRENLKEEELRHDFNELIEKLDRKLQYDNNRYSTRRKISNLNVEFFSSQTEAKVDYDISEDKRLDGEDEYDGIGYIHDKSYDEDSDEKKDNMEEELMSRNYFKSQKKPMNYMNPTSYTQNQRLNDKKYILESHVSPGGSEGVSKITLSNSKFGSVMKKKINREKAFLSSSKISKSERYSSKKKKLLNMASIEQRNTHMNDWNQIKEASSSKEDYPKSRPSNIYNMYNGDTSDYQVNDFSKSINNLANATDLKSLINIIKNRTSQKLKKYSIFYKGSKSFIKSVEKQMHIVLNITTGGCLLYTSPSPRD